MDYQKAFTEVLNQYGLEILENNFLVRSFLCDLIGNSPIDNQLMDIFYSLNKEESIYKKISGLSLKESKEQIKLLIANTKSGYSVTNYIRSVEPLLLYLFPNEYNLYCEKQIVKAKVVRNKQTPLKYTVQLLTKPVVAPKPKVANAQKKVVQKDKIVNLNIRSKNLKITYGSSKDVRVFNKDYTDITNNVSISEKNGIIAVNSISKHAELTIELPKTKYTKVKVWYSGKYLQIKGRIIGLTIDELEVKSGRGNVHIDTDTKVMTVSSCNGDLYIEGTNKVLNVSAYKTNVDCSLSGAYQRSCNIVAKEGNINLNFPGYKIKPKINYIFKRISLVEGVYQVGKRNVKLYLDAQNGYVTAK